MASSLPFQKIDITERDIRVSAMGVETVQRLMMNLLGNLICELVRASQAHTHTRTHTDNF